jgi:hypothetical protein
MSLEHWYELRVAGSRGTSTCEQGLTAGIAISDTGRLCSIQSARARKFATAQEAADYLARVTIPGIYAFEPVLCESGVMAGLARAAG